MNRIVLYRVNSVGWVVPIKKSYRKARYRRHMSRYHDVHEFHKKAVKTVVKLDDKALKSIKEDIEQIGK